jgi:AcrR family transcriptional regulator
MASAANEQNGHVEQPPCAGRPRCAATKQAILDAVWRLLKTTPLAAMSIEQIAREAGVGKATIYRWWDSKAAVALEAFLARYVPLTTLPEKGSAVDRLHQQFKSVVGTYRGDVAKLAAAIIAEGQAHPEVLKMFHEQFVLPRRAATRALIGQGTASGEFDAALDAEVAMDLMYGPIYFRLLVAHAPLNERFADQLWPRVLRVLLPERRTTNPSRPRRAKSSVRRARARVSSR